jgi:hypothetical protein
VFKDPSRRTLSVGRMIAGFVQAVILLILIGLVTSSRSHIEGAHRFCAGLRNIMVRRELYPPPPALPSRFP